MTDPTPTNTQIDKNFRHLVADITWFAIGLPALSRFLSIYAIRVGAGASTLGWLSALPALTLVLSSAYSRRWRQRFSTTVSAQVLPGLGFRLSFLLPALTPLFPKDWQPLWLILSVSIPALPQGVSNVIFIVLLREAVGSSNTLTALVSRRQVALNVALGASTLAMGVWLEQIGFPANYQIMYVAAFAVSLISLWNVCQVRAIYPEEPTPPAQPLASPWRSPIFQRIAFITALVYITFFSIQPLIPLRLVDGLGANEGFMSIYSLAELGAAAIIAFYSSQIVARLGYTRGMALGMIGTGVAGAMLAVLPNLYLTLIPAALSGASWTIAAICVFVFFSQSSPADALTRYSTLYSQITGLAIFAGPVITSQLADTSLGLTAVLLGGAFVRLAAGIVVPFDLPGWLHRAPRPAG